MKKIFIHCGMPKTGSSALQVQLAQSRLSFLKHGYNYLAIGDLQHAERGGITSGNGVDLARAYLNPEHPANLTSRRAELTDIFRQEISRAEGHIILSSEFFSAAPRPLLGQLAEELSDIGEVVLVFFVREQLNALASIYIQQVKRHTLTKYPDEFFSNWSAYKIPLMYHSYFTQLSAKAPRSSILARPYEQSRNHPAGLLGLFLEMIGAKIPVAEMPADSRINLSPSPTEIRLMIEINKHKPRMQFSDMLVEGSYAAGRSNIHAQHAIIPPGVAREISDFFHSENEAFFREFTKSDNIYKNSWVEEDFVDLRQVQFDATSVLDILSGLLVNLDRRLARLEGGT